MKPYSMIHVSFQMWVSKPYVESVGGVYDVGQVGVDCSLRGWYVDVQLASPYVAVSRKQEVRAMALLLEKLQIQRNGDPKDVSCATREIESVSCLYPEWQWLIA